MRIRVMGIRMIRGMGIRAIGLSEEDFCFERKLDYLHIYRTGHMHNTCREN